MVKGITRRVIVADSPDPQIFEQAIFILRTDGGGVSSQQLVDQAVLLLGQGHQHVLLFQRLVGIFNCQTLGSLQGFHRFLGKLVGIHIANLLYRQR